MATKTVECLATFVPITAYKLDVNEFTCLRVKACYCKGNGFCAGFVPAWGNEYCWGCHIDGSSNPLTAGFMVDVEPASKNNAKRLMEIIGNLGKAKEIIAALFDDREWDKLRGVLHNVGRYGYTDAFRKQAEAMLKERESKSEKTEQKSNILNNETMNENVKAADLIGKKIVINGTDKYYKVLSVDGDKLMTEFHLGGDKEPMSVPLPMASLKGFLEKKVWTIESLTPDPSPARPKDACYQRDARTGEGSSKAETEAVQTTPTEDCSIKTQSPNSGGETAASEDEVQEVQDVVPQKPEPKPKAGKAKEVKMEEPKRSEKLKVKSEKSAVEPKGAKGSGTSAPSGKYVYETYTSSKGKTCARIKGFKETDEAYKNAADLHGSASWETAKGKRTLLLSFGAKYVEKAKALCDALNQGKSFVECKAIIDGAKDTKVPDPSVSSGAKTYTLKEVAAMIIKALAGSELPEDIKAAMLKAA